MARDSAAALQTMTPAREGVWVRTGFGLATPFVVVYPASGVRTIEIDEMGRVWATKLISD